MNNTMKCQLCENTLKHHYETVHKSYHFECEYCGDFNVSMTAIGDFSGKISTISKIQRSAICHLVYSNYQNNSPILFSELNIENVFSNTKLPSPALQANNIIEYIGDEYLRSGHNTMLLPINFESIIGSINRTFTHDLINELISEKVLKCRIESLNQINPPLNNLDLRLSLKGWKRFDAIKHGLSSGSDGFIAMKFGCSEHDEFMKKSS